jgi:SAM-dependent methyltransferase
MPEPRPPLTGPELFDHPEALEEYFTPRPDAESPVETMEIPALRRQVGDVSGLRILDLGCGDGWLGEELLRRGAAGYHGVDASAEMVVRAARRLGAAATVTRQPLEELELGAARFDLVVSCLALHYVADLTAALARAAAHLDPGGRLVYTHEHPVVTSNESRPAGGSRGAWTVDGYFRPGARRVTFFGQPVVKYHRTVEHHVTAFAAAGFRLTGLSECAPERERFGARRDEYERRLRIPLFLLLAGTRG